MSPRVIKTEKEYSDAVSRIYELIHSDSKDIEPGTIKGDELEILSILVEQYEDDHFSVEAPDPVEAIRFRMEQMNLKQKDIAPLWRRNKSVRSS